MAIYPVVQIIGRGNSPLLFVSLEDDRFYHRLTLCDTTTNEDIALFKNRLE